LDDLDWGADRGLVWDTEAAERFYDFCRTVLRLSEGQFDGTKFELEPSQKFICGSLFGWKWKATGKRRFRRAYIEQGKGNGKSPLVGAIGLYGLVADGESGAQSREGAAAAGRDSDRGPSAKAPGGRQSGESRGAAPVGRVSCGSAAA
jgi:phage terminase large subunit-like protein